jgi:HEAT repeat protein
MPLIRSASTTPAAVTQAAAEVIRDLGSAQVETRWAAARAAGAWPACAQALADALPAEPSARVREAMLTSLSRMGAAGMAGVLPLLRSDDANLRTGALDALHIIVTANSALLPPLLADADVDIRILSCELARRLPAAQATAMLCELLRTEADANVCAAAVDVLAEVGQREALPVLADCSTRFAASSFLKFAIQVAADRIRAQPAPDRG